MLNKAKRILAVDDNKINLLTLTRLLQAKGHEVVAVDDPAKVLNLLISSKFDLILTDIHMPNVSGSELAKMIRGDLGSGAPPIIAVTADNNPELLNVEKGGFDELLLKPIDFVSLFRVIDSF